jgi:pantoate--beta-alanine ligase
MGAFHQGHLELMRKAKELADITVVSLFVNPTQFKPGEDFEKYPRDEARDFDLATQQGVDVMFCPTTAEMYPSKETFIHVGEVSEPWEGQYRPGHFDGVATVVAKLFNIVRPDTAVFGLKDYQQCLVLARMVRDLNFPVKMDFEETVREEDCLAMSSRNKYLSTEERSVANQLYRELSRIASTLKENSSAEEIQQNLDKSCEKLSSVGFKIDYLDLVEAETLRATRSTRGQNRLIVAAKLGNTRLIDNIGVGQPISSIL